MMEVQETNIMIGIVSSGGFGALNSYVTVSDNKTKK
jgi:hypothetical protein